MADMYMKSCTLMSIKNQSNIYTLRFSTFQQVSLEYRAPARGSTMADVAALPTITKACACSSFPTPNKSTNVVVSRVNWQPVVGDNSNYHNGCVYMSIINIRSLIKTYYKTMGAAEVGSLDPLAQKIFSFKNAKFMFRTPWIKLCPLIFYPPWKTFWQRPRLEYI